MVLICKTLSPSTTLGRFMPSLVQIGPMFLEKIYKFCRCIFAISKSSPLEKDNAPHLKRLEFPLPKNGLCQVWFKLSQLFFRRSFFFNFANVFSLFRNYLSLEKGNAPHLKKLESPLPKDVLCQAWLKLTHWFLRRRFLKFVNVHSLFRNYPPL